MGVFTQKNIKLSFHFCFVNLFNRLKSENVMDNVNNVQITAADDAAIKAAIQTIVTKATPYLHALTDDERIGGFKMGDKSVDFVQKGATYGVQFAAEMPASIKVADLTVDANAVTMLNNYIKPIATLLRGLEDTAMLCWWRGNGIFYWSVFGN